MIRIPKTLFLILTVCSLCCDFKSAKTGIVENDHGINCYDSSGQRHGLWIEDKRRIHFQFDHGILNGEYQVFFDTSAQRPAYSGSFYNNKICGKWKFYDLAGALSFEVDGIEDNSTDSLMGPSANYCIPKYRARLVHYHERRVKAEGAVIFEDIEVGEFYRVGNWLYFGNDEKVTEYFYRTGEYLDLEMPIR
jgi:hypothetical protein